MKKYFVANLLMLTFSLHATEYLTTSLGYFDIIHHKNSSALFGLEYRFKKWDIFQPIMGGFVNGDSGVYGYGGLNVDLTVLPEQLYALFTFAAGAWQQGLSKNLGGTLEFRSGLELDYQFKNQQRIGVGFNHLSNSNIYNNNPGVETLFINYSMPIHLKH